MTSLLIIAAAVTAGAIVLYNDQPEFDSDAYFREHEEARSKLVKVDTIGDKIKYVFSGKWIGDGFNKVKELFLGIPNKVGGEIGDALSAWLTAILTSPTTIMVGVALFSGLILTILILKRV